MARISPRSVVRTTQYDPVACRPILIQRGYRADLVERYAYRPLDNRWIYREVEGGLVGRPSPDYVQHVRRGNVWLSAGQHNRKHEFYQPQVTREVADLHLVESNVELFPLWLAGGSTSNLLEGDNDVRRPNLTQEAMHYLEAIRGTESDLFCHLIAALHAPAYRFENADALRQDWPRVPLPVSPDHLRESAALGKFVCHLLDVESSVDTVTTSAIRGELRPVGLPWKVDGGQIDLSAGDLAVTAGWGHAGQGGVTMPAKGRLVERAYADSELAAFREGVADLDPTFEQLMTCLGDTCLDVYSTTERIGAASPSESGPTRSAATRSSRSGSLTASVRCSAAT